MHSAFPSIRSVISPLGFRDTNAALASCKVPCQNCKAHDCQRSNEEKPKDLLKKDQKPTLLLVRRYTEKNSEKCKENQIIKL